MDNFEKIKMTVPEARKRLDAACSNHGFNVYEPENKNENLCHYRFGDEGIIAIHNTKNGLNLRYKLGKMQEKGKILLEEVFCEQNGEIEQIAGTYAMYSGIISKFNTAENFKIELVNYAVGIEAKLESKTRAPYAEFSGDIVRDQEKITVHIYKAKVLLQGKNYFLWDEICSWIEKMLDAPVNEILVRVTGDKDIFDKIKVSKGSGIIDDAEELLKSRLDQAYHFLFDHDQKFLNSAICLILYENELPDYSCIVLGAFKGLEGYLRKSIAEFIGTRKPEVMAKVYNPKESFGWIFIPGGITDDTYCLVPRYVDKTNPSVNRAFERLYKLLKDDRNPYAHSTGTATRMCATLDDARDLVDNIISAIGQTYNIFK